MYKAKYSELSYKECEINGFIFDIIPFIQNTNINFFSTLTFKWGISPIFIVDTKNVKEVVLLLTLRFFLFKIPSKYETMWIEK